MYKLGDKIIVTKEFRHDGEDFPIGEIRTIIDMYSGYYTTEGERYVHVFHSGNGNGKNHHCWEITRLKLEENTTRAEVKDFFGI